MKAGPWIVLVALFVVRMGMGFQFQLVASTAPQLQPAFSLSFADIGALIGLYMLPGIVLALPASWLGTRFGERRLVGVGIVIMMLGSAICAVAPEQNILLAGRLVSGFGAILMNVLLTKLAMDWFIGGNMVVAMAILVNSWPVGIGLALLIQAPLAVAWGWPAAFWSGAAVALIGLIVFFAVHRPAPNAMMVERGHWPSRAQFPGLLLAAAVWAAFNMAFALVFSFGTTLLVSRGSDVVGANALISLILWVTALTIPFAASLVQRLDGGRISAPLALLAYAAAILYLARLDASLPVLLAVAVIGATPAGANMALVSRTLNAQTRTLGMGIFFTIFYLSMALAPVLAGKAIDLSGDKSAPLVLAAALAALASVCYGATLLRLRIAR